MEQNRFRVLQAWGSIPAPALSTTVNIRSAAPSRAALRVRAELSLRPLLKAQNVLPCPPRSTPLLLPQHLQSEHSDPHDVDRKDRCGQSSTALVKHWRLP